MCHDSKTLMMRMKFAARSAQRGQTMHHPWNSAGTLLGKGSSKTWSKARKGEFGDISTASALKLSNGTDDHQTPDLVRSSAPYKLRFPFSSRLSDVRQVVTL